MRSGFARPAPIGGRGAKYGVGTISLEIAKEMGILSGQMNIGDMRVILEDIKREKTTRFQYIAARLPSRAGCFSAIVGLALIAGSASFSLAQSVPIPRPSPLLPPGIGGPADDVAADAEAETDPEIEPVPAGLSPGALLDPTIDAGVELNFEQEWLNGPDPGNAAEAPIELTPDPANPVDGPLQIAPDLPTAVEDPIDIGLDPAISTGLPIGSNPLLGSPPPTAVQVPYVLAAKLNSEGELLTSDITWRIFEALPGPDDRLELIGEAAGGAIEVRLSPGDYLVHAAYGRAGATKKITVGPTGGDDTVVLDAGALKLSVLVGDTPLLASDEVSFDLYAPDEDGSSERVLVISDAPIDQVIGLNAAIYHVVSRYGDANAVVRADIRVEAGKLTEVSIYQNAARLTLKLVSESGGEALANTSWSILDPNGEAVVESVGAFPSVVLAAGDYTAVANNQGRRYLRDFTVQSGLDRDVEVIAN